MSWLNSLQSVPVFGILFAGVFLVLTSLANGWKEKREGQRLGVEKERRRQEAAAVKKDREILERSKDAEDTANTVRNPGEYGDDRMHDDAASPLPDYHYRD